MFIETDKKKLQNLAIKVDKIMREEIIGSKMKYNFIEARVYNIKTLGVQGDVGTYRHPAEITILKPMHPNGKDYNYDEFNSFLRKLSTRVTNEIEAINKVLYVTATRDDKSNGGLYNP